MKKNFITNAKSKVRPDKGQPLQRRPDGEKRRLTGGGGNDNGEIKTELGGRSRELGWTGTRTCKSRGRPGGGRSQRRKCRKAAGIRRAAGKVWIGLEQREQGPK